MVFNEQDGQKAFDLHNELSANEFARRQLMIDNAKILTQLKKEKLYQAVLGDDQAQWSAYLAQIDVMYSRNEVYTLMRIYNRFEVQLGIELRSIQNIPNSRLYDLLKVVTKDNVQDWLDKASTLTNRDWIDELRIAKGKKPSEDCPHKFVEYEVCADCGVKHKKDGNEKHEASKKTS